jgi:protein-tyrosine phosphatase
VTDKFTILAVCTGNIHRSALAGELMATWAGWYPPPELRDQIEAGSAGTRAPAGEPMGRTTRKVAASLGADGRAHRARMLDDGLIDHADLILAASRAHRDEIVRRVPRAMRRTFTIREAGRIAAMLPVGTPRSVSDLAAIVANLADLRPQAAADAPADDDIIDPHRRDVAVTDEMVREEVPALAELAVALLGMPRPEADAYLRAVDDPSSLR